MDPWSGSNGALARDLRQTDALFESCFRYREFVLALRADDLIGYAHLVRRDNSFGDRSANLKRRFERRAALWT